MKIAKSFTDLVGNTPLLEINNFNKSRNLKARIVVKLECFNPLSSSKDRIAVAMIEEAEKNNLIDRKTIIIEPTSGNTGVGLAGVCASKGYKLILTMPENMSVERRKLLKQLGAELVLTPKELGMNGAVSRALELCESYKKAFIPQQFENEANPNIHEKTTAKEIWQDTDGMVDIFVASIGTGGTVTGTSRGLKKFNDKIKVYGVEPKDSPLLNGGKAGGHKIQGIGANFIPKIYDKSVVDGVIDVSAEDSFKNAKALAKEEGILVGISSGATLQGAIELANRQENSGKLIVALLTDTGERYISSELFD